MALLMRDFPIAGDSMSNEVRILKSSGPSAEKTVSAGIHRALEIYGPNLAEFFRAVEAQLKKQERRGVQMELPLSKSK